MPRSAVIFPYGVALRQGATVEVFPAAEVSILSSDGEWLTLLFIIDSGATLSAMPSTDGATLGVVVPRGTPISISVVSGEIITGWKHEVTVRIGHKTISLPCVFLNRESSPRVLGRAGVFDIFTIVFEEAKRRSAFVGTNTPAARSITRILDKESVD